MINRLVVLVIVGLGIIVSSCEKESTYEQMVRSELATGVRSDSLFLGYRLGMTKDEFYNYSWQLNKKQLVKEGPYNQTVEYKIDEELPHPASMNFYPDFKRNKIYRMRVAFSYDGWAPWNKNLSSDSLYFDVKQLMEQWYGDGFIEIEKPELGNSFAKIDGNREILIFKADETTVNVFFTDLLAVKQDSNID